tara:strand:- start:10655 stop:11713 length:1059 start_codon:yes stop_codon:yes gene_type:complete
MTKKHIFDTEGFSAERKKEAENLKKTLLDQAAGQESPIGGFAAEIEESMKAVLVPPGAGIMGTTPMAPTINFQAAPNDLQLGPDGNSAIVFGTDRPATQASGWGAKGSNRCNAIDIVVGRMSSARGGSGPIEGTSVSPSFVSDAARIYISQQTDVDFNFGLCGGALKTFGLIQGKSAIGIKADAVRMIGRLGIKLVTGRSFEFEAGPQGETDSTGGTISSPAPPIELIAGNNDGTQEFLPTKWLPQMSVNNLQGVAKGENVRDGFRDLSRILDQFLGVAYNQSLIQLAFNSVIGINPLAPHYGAIAGLTGAQALAFIQNSLWHIRINKIIWELNYTYPFGFKYLTSRNVYST